MSSDLDKKKNYKIFADNFFTSLPLLKHLQERGIHFVGTVRANRLKGCDLKTEKELRKEGRGSCDSKVEANSNALVVRWYDNKTVDTLSSCVGIHPMVEVDRWDKKQGQRIKVKCPQVIATYNKYMGGVDLLDSLCALYKFNIRTKRWYLRIFYHMVIVAVVVSWLWYRRHCTLLNERTSDETLRFSSACCSRPHRHSQKSGPTFLVSETFSSQEIPKSAHSWHTFRWSTSLTTVGNYTWTLQEQRLWRFYFHSLQEMQCPLVSQQGQELLLWLSYKEWMNTFLYQICYILQ